MFCVIQLDQHRFIHYREEDIENNFDIEDSDIVQKHQVSVEFLEHSDHIRFNGLLVKITSDFWHLMKLSHKTAFVKRMFTATWFNNSNIHLIPFRVYKTFVFLSLLLRFFSSFWSKMSFACLVRLIQVFQMT